MVEHLTDLVPCVATVILLMTSYKKCDVKKASSDDCQQTTAKGEQSNHNCPLWPSYSTHRQILTKIFTPVTKRKQTFPSDK